MQDSRQHTVICYFFSVEIFSDGALRPKFCYMNIFPTLIFLKYACAYTRAKRAQRRRTSIFPLLLPQQDRPRMSILRYFKPVLPNSRGLLSADIPSSAIASANREVQRVLSAAEPESKRRGSYHK